MARVPKAGDLYAWVGSHAFIVLPMPERVPEGLWDAVMNGDCCYAFEHGMFRFVMLSGLDYLLQPMEAAEQ